MVNLTCEHRVAAPKIYANRNNARLQAGLLFLTTIAILVRSVLAEADDRAGAA
jgi:hypothetical protein